ncbi:hypothetical protein BLNAU_7533 [Blattamonas nauphoetae]|uniref:Uncharacterized protein n=1 Tax=Blattamonas nauphoetae TaxID=2049346 RepID=A0ABQ9Y1Q2_9EUKA|nr:hypothetical protein BLNAU_7533 [Blattamonas nauphoetae]
MKQEQKQTMEGLSRVKEREGADELVSKGVMVENKGVVLSVKGRQAQSCGGLEERMGLGEGLRVKSAEFGDLEEGDVKFQPALDDALETKAVKFLESVTPENRDSADAFQNKLTSNSDDSSTDFIQSIVVLLSSTSQVLTASTVKMLYSLIEWISPTVQFTLVQAGLIPQLITTLNPLTLSFTEAVDIHAGLMSTIT